MTRPASRPRVVLALAVGLMLPALPAAFAQQTLGPCTCYPNPTSSIVIGQARIAGAEVAEGDVVSALDPDGHCAGAALIESRGGRLLFILPVYGDDPATPDLDEGLEPGDSITLQVTRMSDRTIWELPSSLAGWSGAYGAPLEAYADPDAAFDFTVEAGTFVAREAGEAPPDAYRLTEPRPNPFTTSSILDLRIATAQHVRIELFDALGRRVQTVHDGVLPAGPSHRFVIDGPGLPSGIYLYKIRGAHFQTSGTVIRLR